MCPARQLSLAWIAYPSLLLAGVVAARVAQPLEDERSRRRALAAVPAALAEATLTFVAWFRVQDMGGPPLTARLGDLIVQPLFVVLGAVVTSRVLDARRVLRATTEGATPRATS